jgi:hypothetical protein
MSLIMHMHIITIIGTSCMLGVYSMYPHQICAHVANADVLLFQDYFNKIILPFHLWVKMIIIRCTTLCIFTFLNFCLKYNYYEDTFND